MFRALLIIAISSSFVSCRVLNPERMLRTPRGFEYSEFDKDAFQLEYRLAPNDKINFRIFTNDGERLIDPLNPGIQQTAGDHQIYTVEFDGMVKLPVLGRIKISGLTLREAETYLEERFSEYFNNPFVQLTVTNSRVIVFPGGGGGTARVVYLENPNTTLFEALALAGGIIDGKSHRIKLIRGEPANTQVYLIDLSTIRGINDANMVVQADDIIYVEPRARVSGRLWENIAPILTLLSSTLIIYSLIRQ